MRRMFAAALGMGIAAAVVAGGCNSPVRLGEPEGFALGTHRRDVSTKSAAAQYWFDQGLVWAFSFNHDEAIRSFERAKGIDPKCAMAWWGIAYCNGPHINYPEMDEARSRAAWEALSQARALLSGASPVERALIDALGARYADPGAGPLPMTFDQRAPLDRAYADAMRRVHQQFPRDMDVAVMFAEALMDLRPWDLWDLDGLPRPETPEVVSTLEKVLAAAPGHPGAMHLYIHAVEGSKHPEKADAAAERLRTAVPAAGHMVHMPAHIDARVGRWAKASDQNEAAMAADAAYVKRSPRQGFYRLYMAHNEHFLAYACMMEGRSKDAIAAARGMAAGMPAEWVEQNAPIADAYTGIVVEALMRFGRWDDLLDEPQPPEHLPITRSLWRMGRAVALAARGETAEAEREYGEFKAQVARVPAGARMAQNPAEPVLKIADNMIAGEIAYRRGRIEAAVHHLREAARIEDTLRYIEPPDWVQPARHTLGAVLMEAGRVEEAESVYREDLARNPENGWALFGLWKCREAKGAADAAEIGARFKRAWGRADVRIGSSCLCVPGK